MVRALLVVVLFVAGMFVCADAGAQTTPRDSAEVKARLIYEPRDRTIEIWGGITHPLSHRWFKRFWLYGPSAGIGFHFRASDNVKLGFGAEASLLSFRRGNFAVWNPGVPVQVKHLALVNVFLSARRYFYPTSRWSPFIGAEVGFTRISGAEYKVIVNDVRVTYYDIPGALRLTGSAVLGVDYYLNRRIAFQAVARFMYIHNDSNIGNLLNGRGGIKITL